MEIKRKFARKCMAALVISALVFPAFGVLADDDDDLNGQLSDVQGMMQQQVQKQSEADAVIGSVFDKMRVIQENLDAAQAEYKTVANQLQETDNNIAQKEAELQKAQKRLSAREDVLSQRIRDIYKNGQLNYIDVVLGAKSFDDFSNRVELLRRIVGADLDLIDSIKAERDQITAQKMVLEQERQEKVKLKMEAQKKREEIQQHKSEQTAILAKAQNDKATAQAAYDELEASSQQIGAMLRQRQADRAAAAAPAPQPVQDSSSDGGSDSASYAAPAPSYGSGAFMWPVNGVITSPFGYRSHPIFGRQILHSGIDIGIDCGTPVHAADGGVVVEAGWISGYGYAVVIDHGNGLSTLYGHNESLAVGSGQSVGKGQVIAYAGSTGNSTGPHVHFEVRANGDPVDPMSYL